MGALEPMAGRATIGEDRSRGATGADTQAGSASSPSSLVRDPWCGAVLAGGASARMGRDKALVEIGGRPLVSIAVEALRGAGAGRVLVIGGDTRSLARLGLEVVPDRNPGTGPLGGVLTAFATTRSDVVVVLACDLPGVDAASVVTVLEALHDDRSAAVAWPEEGGHQHVLQAAWRVARSEPVLTAAFASGERSLRRATATLPCRKVSGIPASALRNANRPDDLPGG